MRFADDILFICPSSIIFFDAEANRKVSLGCRRDPCKGVNSQENKLPAEKVGYGNPTESGISYVGFAHLEAWTMG